MSTQVRGFLESLFFIKVNLSFILKNTDIIVENRDNKKELIF